MERAVRRFEPALFLCMVLLLLLTNCSRHRDSSAPSPEVRETLSMKVSYVEGEVLLGRQGIAETAEAGTNLLSEDTIATGPGGMCDISVGTLGSARILSETQVRVGSLAGTMRQEGSVRLLSGAIVAKCRRLIETEFLSIAADEVVFGVRGTEFGVTYDGTNSIVAGVSEGSIQIVPRRYIEHSDQLSSEQTGRLMAAFPTIDAGQQISILAEDIDGFRTAGRALERGLADDEIEAVESAINGLLNAVEGLDEPSPITDELEEILKSAEELSLPGAEGNQRDHGAREPEPEPELESTRRPVDLGPVGDVLALNGEDTAIHIPYREPVIITDEITIETLFLIEAFNEDHRLCGFMPGTIHGFISQSSDKTWAGNYALGVSQHGAFFMFEPTDSHYVVDVDIEVGRWYHVAVTHTFGRGRDAAMYINGEEVPGRWVDDDGQAIDGDDTIGEPVSDRPYMVGRIGDETPDDRHFLAGRLDELRIWNRIRAPNEILRNVGRSLSGSEPGLVVNLSFDAALSSLDSAGGIPIESVQLDQTVVGRFYGRMDSNFHSVPVHEGRTYEIIINDEWSGYPGHADNQPVFLFFTDDARTIPGANDPVAEIGREYRIGNPYKYTAGRNGYLIVYTQSDNPNETSYELTVGEREAVE